MAKSPEDLQSLAEAGDDLFELKVKDFLYGFWGKLGGPKIAGEKMGDDYEALPPGHPLRIQVMKTVLMYTNLISPENKQSDELSSDEDIEEQYQESVKRANQGSKH